VKRASKSVTGKFFQVWLSSTPLGPHSDAHPSIARFDGRFRGGIKQIKSFIRSHSTQVSGPSVQKPNRIARARETFTK
jgi:hypothetical protein